MTAANFNIASSRQLKAARTLAGLTQSQLSTEAGFNPRAAKYWESWGNALPSTIPATLRTIEATLLRHGVEFFSDPTPGCRLVSTE